MAKLKRNLEGYIAKAEKEIDTAWTQLPVFRSGRAAALLSLITAADDRVRLLRVKGTSLWEQFAFGVRFGQDALTWAIPWIFRECAPTDAAIPRLVTEVEWMEGSALVDYAEAYDSAVIGFTLYHQKRYNAHVAKVEPRITFSYASERVAAAELEKRAYEMYEQEFETLGAMVSLSGDQLRLLENLKVLLPLKAVREDGDRVTLNADSELISMLRSVCELNLSIHPAHIEEGQALAGVPYRSYRRYFGSLSALVVAHSGLHTSSAVSDIFGGAVSSLALRMKLDDLNRHLSAISELESEEVATISRLLTYDGTIPNMPPICQPLVMANGAEVLVPHVFSEGSRLERNLLKLLARHPLTRKSYDRFSPQKEGIALGRLTTLLDSAGVACKTRVSITNEGRSVTDVDILAYDPRDGCLLVIQHKWLIEPDTVNETKDCDAELARGIERARVARSFLADVARVRQALPQVPLQGYSSLEAVVVSKGFEPTGFIEESDVPVITESWFTLQFGKCSGLKALHERAKSRPDRKRIAGQWEPTHVSARLAGYEVRVPGYALPLAG